VESVGSLDHLHRYGALAVFAGAIVVVAWLRRATRENTLVRWSTVVLALAALQVALGIVMAYVSLVPAAQVLHLSVASLLLGGETVLLLVSRKT
jgi:heme A synthase